MIISSILQQGALFIQHIQGDVASVDQTKIQNRLEILLLLRSVLSRLIMVFGPPYFRVQHFHCVGCEAVNLVPRCLEITLFL